MLPCLPKLQARKLLLRLPRKASFPRLQVISPKAYHHIHLQNRTLFGEALVLGCRSSPTLNLKKPLTNLILLENLEMVDLVPYIMVCMQPFIICMIYYVLSSLYHARELKRHFIFQTGVLADGRVVAVKRLYENNFKRAEQFINEVEILTRLRHQNLVTLFGCTSRRSQELLLVYEYIPNGTVADHLHGKRAKSGLLSWPVRLKIAVETADALAYLHKSDIIHRDVKTNNLLLDNDFHVKVADFGLSRLFPTNVTHVSTAPQGTPGYVDPEYYQCYQLTEKSDVYSFGVVLIELISSLQAVDTNRHRHDINLSNMAVNKIQNHTLHELVDSSLGFQANGSVRRMVTLVAELAFRCLQQEKDMRPSMEEVLEALKGIQNDDLNAHKVEIVDLSMDDDAGLLKGSITPRSQDSLP